MEWQRPFWFRLLVTKQLKRANAGHGEVTINNATTVVGLADILSINKHANMLQWRHCLLTPLFDQLCPVLTVKLTEHGTDVTFDTTCLQNGI